MSWKDILKNDLSEYLEYLIQEELWEDPYGSDILARADGMISNDESSPYYSFDHKEAQNGVWLLESFGGHESGSFSVRFYKNGKHIEPTPISALLKLLGLTQAEAQEMRDEDEEFDGYHEDDYYGRSYGGSY